MKVSVLTPIFNTDSTYLKEMIESILNQSFKDFEFLLLNDSPECKRLDDIVEVYQKQDPRIKYFKSEKNQGISESRNFLLGKASGEYIAIFDHDDISKTTRLQEQVDYLDRYQDIGVVGSFAKIIDSSGNPSDSIKQPIDNKTIKRRLMNGCAVHHSSAMIRRSLLVDNNIRWETSYSPCEDYMLFVRLMGKTLFHNIPENLLLYRHHPNQTSVLKQELMEDVEERVRSVAASLYPSWKTPQWFYLFGFIPLIKIQKRLSGSTRYLLFGWIPLARLL